MYSPVQQRKKKKRRDQVESYITWVFIIGNLLFPSLSLLIIETPHIMAIDITEHFCSMLHSKPLQEFFFFFGSWHCGLNSGPYIC
jgi:hypothetical protein